MSVLRSRRGLGDTPYNLIPSRVGSRTGSVQVTPDTALRSSAVWAALRLRADLISTMPIDVYRRVGGMQVEVPKPPVLVNPGGEDMNLQEWLYATQFELDRSGNCFGIISERDGMGLPRRIDLVESRKVTVLAPPDKEVQYRIGNTTYAKADIWHERAFTAPGLVMGMSPVSYAAWTLGQYQSAIEFGLEWFANGGFIPGGIFKNTSKTLQPQDADGIKRKFKESVASRDVLVTGNDWEYSTVSVASNESQFLDTQHASGEDIARFFGVPGDLIDIQSTTKSAVTYASITQRNLQFLIMNLGPAFVKRELALSRLVAQGRYVKFNTDALLRMDPDTRNNMILAQVAGKTRTRSEAREQDNLPPFTDAQIAELKEFDSVPPAAAVPAVTEGIPA